LSKEEAWWRKFPKETYEYPEEVLEGTIVMEYLNSKGEVVMSQPCFAFAKWSRIWSDIDYNIRDGMLALFGEKE
jgi:hypothetical protein